jgi:hypothetical protein
MGRYGRVEIIDERNNALIYRESNLSRTFYERQTEEILSIEVNMYINRVFREDKSMN